MKIETYVCDIEECSNPPISHEAKSMDVIFTTEQTEGRGCKRYLSRETIHICHSHMDKVLEGNYIVAYGAMGHNTYTL